MRRAIGLLLVLTGCSDGTGTTTDTVAAPASEEVAFAVSVVSGGLSVVDSESTRPLVGQWQVVINELAGVGGRVNFVNSTLRDAESGAVAWPTGYLSLNAEGIAAQAGTNRLAAKGTLRVSQSLQFALLSGGRRAVVTVAVQFLDERGRLLTQTAEGRVE